MPIDWFTIGAQLINFLILVWLLKRFLYRPILDAIDAREQRIAKEIADADTKKAEAEGARKTLQQKNEAFDRQRDGLMARAEEEAKMERQRLLDDARQAADTLRVNRLDALKREQQNLSDEIARRVRQEVFALTRKTLADLAGTALEENMSGVLIRRLRELGDGAREEFAGALKTSSGPVLVRSAFDLPPEQQTAIRLAINETFSADIPIRFESAPDLVSGIEMTANGRKIAWSIDHYLTSLEQDVSELLLQRSQPGDRPGAEPGA